MRLLSSVLKKSRNGPSWFWVLLSGVLLGLNAPGRDTELVGIISLFPLLLVLDRIAGNRDSSWKQKVLRAFSVCWITGAIAALLGVPWLTYSARVFGKLPFGIAIMVTGIGYGMEVALALFICFAVPLLAVQRRGWRDLLFCLSFFLMIEPFCPRLFYWSFGGLTFARVTLISQMADLIGAPGLGIYSVGFSMFLLLVWRAKVEHLSIPAKVLRFAAVSYLILSAIGLTYGIWRIHTLESQLKEGPRLHIVALQPNFSFARLVSNQTSGYSAMQRSIYELLENSKHALLKYQTDPLIPRLLIWPESVFPSTYFKDVNSQRLVKDFTSYHRTSLLFHSVDWEDTPLGRRFYGVSVLVGPDGELKGRYNKMFLIPFGEYIPGARFFPSYATWLKKRISHLSEFERGKEFTVFGLSKDIRFSAPICFDVFSPTIIPNMVRNGAKLVINLGNLIWFGKTNASDQMQMALRLKAIENRIPIALVSNNGRSLFINALGSDSSKQLGLFERGSLSQTIVLKKHFSFYREYTTWVHLTFALVFILITILGVRKGKIFHKE